MVAHGLLLSCHMNQKTVATNPSVMTVTELADYLRIHRTTLYRLLKNGKIPAFRVGSDWRFNKERIDQWQMSFTADVD